MKILAIETSCDETACAIVEDGRNVLASIISWIKKKPFFGVNHLDGHIASNYLSSTLSPPFLCLLVSGGHTQLRLVNEKHQTQIIGETLDDAVGESYDKVARLLGLPYPGGPNVDKLACLAYQNKNIENYRHKITLPMPQTEKRYDFSLSGLKTAVARQYEKLTSEIPAGILSQLIAEAFQERVVEMLVQKTKLAAIETNVKTVALAGGVAANSRLREKLANELSLLGKQLFVPELKYCTDNAAMIASAAFFTPITDSIDADVFSRSS